MQIAIIAIGSRGDVQPYVALGKGLRDAGHAVKVLASSDFRELVTAQGLEFADVGGGLESVARGMQDLLEKGNFLKILASMNAAARQMAPRAAANGLEACRGADRIVAGLGGLGVGFSLAEKLDLPFLPALVYPFTPTREFPAVLAPLPESPLTAPLNRASHRLARRMLWQTARAADDHARREVLGLPAAGRHGPFVPGRPILYGYSPLVVPVPADWDASNHVAGFWFLPPPAGWQPPVDLLDFLQAGPPPVYIGFGSMSSGRPGQAAALVLEALARTGQRGVLYAGWGGLQPGDLPANVYMTGSIPHSWLFPRMAAVVPHGGASTTAAGLAAGVPSVLIPFMGDQPFWGRRVQALGVGPRAIPRRQLTVERLAGAIRRALTDTDMRAAAAVLGERIRAEDGLRRAVRVIEQF